jgi:preprotein translocase subunit SecA
MSFWSKLTGTSTTKGVNAFKPLVPKINALEPAMQALSDAELKAKTAEFKERLKKGEGVTEKEEAILAELLPEAFAVVREASRRTLGQRHFDVQLIGGMILNSGGISEMRTGEGKTLVATLPAYLNALTSRGVHVVTVNDYLSRRDAAWMGQIYDALGLTVAVINHESSYLYDATAKATPATPAGETTAELDKERDATGSFKVVHEFLRPVTRREAYQADITYGTNVEFGFDYLRDNLEYNPQQLRQRDFNYAIVDEIDSILIDEARTPLIISAPTRDAEATYKQFASMVATFVPSTSAEAKDGDYTTDEKHKSIALTSAGIAKAEKALGVDNIYTDAGIKFVHHLETAIRAKAMFHINKEYVVKNDEIVIVDEFTGRLQPGRRWSEGLHQAIEAKEGVKIQQESRTFATVTYQNFFRMYPKLAGMTGTASTSAEEFYKVYGLETYIVPTNKPVQRTDLNDQIFRTEQGKFKAIARKVKELNQSGQPVLIGTVSIEKNELLSQFLKSEGIAHTILNAKPEYAEKEGEIIAQAGKKGAVTISTNMAGRGVDVKLGGSPNTPETYEAVRALGGLFVLGTERHEARRIDNQLRGRSGRQGDPGATQFFVSLEDSLMRVFASDMLKSMMGRLGMAEDQPIEHKLISRSLESAQEKIEGFNFDSRKHVLEFDDVINQQRTSVYGDRRKLLLGSVDDVETQLNAMIGEEAAGDASVSPEAAAAREAVTKKIAEFGREPFLNAIRVVLLQTIDMFWVEHLEVMDYTRSSVNLRAFGQRDPLIEYKKEGLRLYKEMQAATQGQVMRMIPNIIPVVAGSNAAGQPQTVIPTNPVASNEKAPVVQTGGGAPGTGEEPGRNDPCWCGSGKKYKKCHGVGK